MHANGENGGTGERPGATPRQGRAGERQARHRDEGEPPGAVTGAGLSGGSPEPGTGGHGGPPRCAADAGDRGSPRRAAGPGARGSTGQRGPAGAAGRTWGGGVPLRGDLGRGRTGEAPARAGASRGSPRFPGAPSEKGPGRGGPGGLAGGIPGAGVPHGRPVLSEGPQDVGGRRAAPGGAGLVRRGPRGACPVTGGHTGGPGLPRGGAGGRWPEGVHGTGANTGSPGLSGAYAGRESRMGRPLGRGARGEAWGNGLPSGPGPGGRGRRSRTRAGEAGSRGRGVTGSRVMPGVPDGRGPHRCHRRGALVQPRTARPAPRIGPGNPPRLPAGEGQSPVIGPVPRGQSAPHSPTPALRGEP